MNLKKIGFLHSEIFADFSKHLLREDNSRILFSAPFGNGKTTFLNEFFKSNEEKFIYVSLYPVNYSVATNRDVFELIKYDLLSTLIEKYHSKIDLQKEDFTLLLTSQTFIAEKIRNFDLPSLIRYLISAGEMIGKTAAPILKALGLFIKDIKEFQESMESDEATIIKRYLEDIEQTNGNIYGSDAISKLICDFIKRIKNKSKSDQLTSVLVIDDLDRLDPEHIFRLFNIFSAQHVSHQEMNKFNFDKVIFVCDINNIRNIFHFKYGLDVDFNGYIDKFYSDEVFHFDNISLIKKALDLIVNQTPYEVKNPTDEYSIHSRTKLYGLFEWVSFSLLESRLLNLRSIIATSYISFPRYTFRLNGHPYEINAYKSGILLIFYLLKQFLGSIEIVRQTLRKLADSNEAHPIYSNHFDSKGLEQNVMTYLLPLILPPKDGFPLERKDNDTNYTYQISEKDFVIHYRYSYNFSRAHGEYEPYFIKATQNQEIDSEEVNINLYKILYELYDSCVKNKIIR